MFTVCDDETPHSPLPILAKLREYPELAELDGMLEAGCTIAFLICHEPPKLRGQFVGGYCSFPAVQGNLKGLFEWMLEEHLGYFPTWIIGLDRGFWELADDRQREALLFHELLHAGQAKDKYGCPRIERETGMPVPAILPHDLEEFNAVVARYGAWSPDIEAFLAASR